jgi:ribosomal-protein-alanine N-acetyltransferase
MSRIRPLELDDAERLAALLDADRAILAHFDPLHDESWFTPAGQRERIGALVPRRDAGLVRPHAILDDDGELAGTLFVNNIVRGAFQSASLGYWVSSSRTGRGLARGAVAAAVELGFGELRLHRLEAGTLPENHASQRVLERNGFRRYGHAPHYLHIGGAWRDHVLFQRTVEDPGP